MRRSPALVAVIGMIAAGALASTLAVSAGASGAAPAATTLTIYSGREESLVKPLFDRFTQSTGIDVRVRYGETAALAATLLEEGRNSPADVFFAQDAGALGVVAGEGRLSVLPEATLRRVPKRFRAAGKRWVGVSGRARVVAFNTQAFGRKSLPRTIWGYTAPRFRDKIGLPPTNASFQAFVTVMRLQGGEQRTRSWLSALKANGVRFYARNAQVLSALASREIAIGFVNHYYLYQLKEQQPRAPVANLFLGKRDPGAFVNVAGAGIVTSTKQRKAALRFVNFLLSKPAQRFFASGPGRAEYPLVSGVKPRTGLPGLRRVQGPGVTYWRLGRELPRTLTLLNELGYTG